MAAQASGGNNLWITSRHLLPNSLPQLTSYAGTYFAWTFLAVTTLTFLGLAGDPSIPEWGALLNSSRSHLQSAPLACGRACIGDFTHGAGSPRNRRERTPALNFFPG